MPNREYLEEETSVRDSVCGVVTGGCRSGLFLKLENGQEAFARFGGIYPGTRVLCTVIKRATDRWRVLVSVDSVLDGEAA